MKTICIIQARMGSTRLPGKVMADLGDYPVLAWVVRACRAAPGVDQVIVATSVLPGDDLIQHWCIKNDVAVVRGSETDVLSRFVEVANYSPDAEVFLRITADCPFVDPRVIGEVIELRRRSGAAYCSNIHPRTYPDGLDVECFARCALMTANSQATREIDRDTVTYWIVRNRSRFPAEAVVNPIPGMQDERWVLDTQADYDFCAAIAQRWPWDKGPPSQLDILNILERNPEIRKINAAGVMNERFYQGLADEPLYRRTYVRSQAQLARAEKVIPLGAQTFSKSKVQFPQPSPLFLSHGQGGLCWDIDGNEYVDMVSALLPNVLGYRDVDVDTAVRRQLGLGISFSLATEIEAQLAETLCRLIPCAEMARFGKTGSDVTTAAVRLARAVTGRDRIITTGYHGWHDWTVARNLGVPEAVRKLSERVPFGDRTKMHLAHKPIGADAAERAAAIIVEPDGDPEYLRYLRNLTESTGTILIFDEVITGFRYHLSGAQALYGVTPDLACFGKAMGNGMPISALVGRRDIMQRMAPGPDGNIFYSGTFFGETLSIAAAIATIDKLERTEGCARLERIGLSLAGKAKRLVDQHGLNDVIKFSGHASRIIVSVNDCAPLTADQIRAIFLREMIGAGVLIIGSHNVCTAHSQSDIARVVKAYGATLAAIREAIETGVVPEQPMAKASVR